MPSARKLSPSPEEPLGFLGPPFAGNGCGKGYGRPLISSENLWGLARSSQRSWKLRGPAALKLDDLSGLVSNDSGVGLLFATFALATLILLLLFSIQQIISDLLVLKH